MYTVELRRLVVIGIIKTFELTKNSSHPITMFLYVTFIFLASTYILLFFKKVNFCLKLFAINHTTCTATRSISDSKYTYAL